MSRPSVKMIDYRFETLLNYFNEILQTFNIENDWIFSLCHTVLATKQKCPENKDF